MRQKNGSTSSKRFGVHLLFILGFHSKLSLAEIVRLEQLEEQAVHRRAAVAGDRANVAAARADADVARSGYHPTLTVNVMTSGEPGAHLINVNDTSGTAYLVAGSRPIGAEGALLPDLHYGGILSLQGKVYDFGRTRAAVAAAESRLATAEVRGQASRDAIIGQVRATYLDWLGAALLRGVSERALANARARLELVQARVASGTRPPADLELARYEETLAELDDCEARQRVQSAKLSVEQASGGRLAPSAAPDPSLLDREAPRPGGLEAAETVALARQKASALAMARFYEHDTAPVLSATADAGIRGQSEHVFPAYRAAVSLVIPVWDGGAAAARAARAREEAAVFDAKEREQRAAVSTERTRAWNDWVGAAERVRLAETLYAAAAARARDAEERYDLGEGRIEAVLETGAGLTRAEHEVVLAKIFRADAAIRTKTPVPAVSGVDAP